MAIYEITADSLRKIDETSFAEAGIKERGDLQRLLRTQIEVISPDTLVIAEEFGEWQESKRRIDLLGIDKDANLVVVELKRNEDGGHMELQAIRYAAMVSTMTFDKAVEVYTDYLAKIGKQLDARESLLDFLDWSEPDEDRFAQDVRMILASAEFSKELTTAVMWLNDRDLDIRCIRMKPYRDEGKLLVDVQQVIPLPEAEEYQIQIKKKQQKERQARKFNFDLTKFNVTIKGKTHERLAKRVAIYLIVRHLCDSGYTPDQIADAVPWRRNTMFRGVQGSLNSEEYIETALKEAKSNGESFEAKRFFCGDEELIASGDSTYAFTNQWGKKTYEAMELLLKRFPDIDITCEKHSH